MRMVDRKGEKIAECITSLRSRHREERRVVASVAVPILLVALLLLLVNPLDNNVPMARPRRVLFPLACLSKGHGGILCSGPFRNF